MANILDYILWRGDLDLSQSEFNEVDNLILSKIAYLNFEEIVDNSAEKKIALKDAAQKYFEADRHRLKNTGDLLYDEFIELLKLAASSRRFQNLFLSAYVDIRDTETETQFSAITIELCKNTSYIAFSGTDDTLIGWKEDFKMSFLDVVPAQEKALKYYIDVANKLGRRYKFYLGGHSKGGNLAVYAAVNAPESLQKRINGIYNNDGPGFKESLLQTEKYQRISGKVTTIVPQSSIVGMLLEHEENYTVVKSNQKAFLQHYGFNWEVIGSSFIHLKSITKESQMLDKTLKKLLNSLTIEQREVFTNSLFDVLSSNDNKTISEIREDGLKAFIAMIKTYEGLDKEIKKAISDTAALLFAESVKAIRFVSKPEQWKERLPLIKSKNKESDS